MMVTFEVYKQFGYGRDSVTRGTPRAAKRHVAPTRTFGPILPRQAR